jgi:hypothetical protein
VSRTYAETMTNLHVAVLPRQQAALREAATRGKTTVAAVVRQAIDSFVAPSGAGKQEKQNDL